MASLSSNMNFISDIGKSDTIHIGVIPTYDEEDYDLTNKKSRSKFISDLERFVRKSQEYKRLMKYCKNNGMNTSTFSEISGEGNAKIKIEMHHYPITLMEICLAVIGKREYNGESMCIEDVAKEVMYIHYLLYVGLVPLTTTEHQLQHKGYLFINTDKVFGQYRKFMEMYEPWLPEGLSEKIDDIEYMSTIYNEEVNKNPLRVRYIYTDSSQSYGFPEMSSVLEMLSDRMEYLKSVNYSMKPDKNVISSQGYIRNDLKIPVYNQLQGDYEKHIEAPIYQQESYDTSGIFQQPVVMCQDIIQPEPLAIYCEDIAPEPLCSLCK